MNPFNCLFINISIVVYFLLVADLFKYKALKTAYVLVV